MKSTFFLIQQGTTFIEVLISLIVLSIGLVSLTALQAKGLRFNQESYQRSIALIQAHEMVERMRANSEALTAGTYDSVSGAGTNPGCSSSCSSANMAQQDIYDWNINNAILLPSGAGTISKSGDVFTVSMMWDAQRTGATGTDCSGDTSVDLTCLQIDVQL